MKTRKSKQLSQLAVSKEGLLINKSYAKAKKFFANVIAREERVAKVVITSAEKMIARINKLEKLEFGHTTLEAISAPKKVTAHSMLIDTITGIGKPATANEIVDILFKEKNPAYRKFTKKRAKLTQVVYNGCSTLTHAHTIARKAVDKKTFAYGLPSMIVKAKTKHRMAA